MEHTFVSIVIPTYNRKELLEKCLKSLAHQTYPKDKFEIIIVDDGSTDGTEEKISLLAKREIDLNIIYYRQANQGPIKARNHGIEKSQGNVIGFLDDDMFVDNKWIENSVLKFDSNLVGGVEGKVLAVEQDILTPFTHKVENTKPLGLMIGGVFYRKNVLKEIGLFDERFMLKKHNLYCREDSDVALAILEKGYKIVFAQHAIAYHPTLHKNAAFPLRFARYGYFEPLFYMKHKTIMKNCKRYGINRKAIIALPYYYYGYYVAILLVFISIFTPLSYFYSLGSFAFSYLTTIYARCRGRHISAKDLFMLAVIYTIIPYGRLYYIIKGCIKFRSFVFL